MAGRGVSPSRWQACVDRPHTRYPRAQPLKTPPQDTGHLLDILHLAHETRHPLAGLNKVPPRSASSRGTQLPPPPPQVFGDGVQLSNSPVLVRIVDRDCAAAFGPASLRAADDAGACVCGAWAVEVAGGTCMLVGALVAVVAVPLVAALILGGVIYLRLKTRALDGCPPPCIPPNR
jgi:hypothetical protein